MILMLDQGPLHARFGISLADRPIDQQRIEFVNELIDRLDTDGNNELSQAEANHCSLFRQKARSRTDKLLKRSNAVARQNISDTEIALMVRKVAGRSVVFRQNDSASESDEFIFGLLDTDQSGIVDQNEMTSAAGRLILRDADRDGCVGFDEVQPPVPEPDPNLLVIVDPPTEELTHAVFSEILRLANEPLLPERLIRKYDQNGNGLLSAKELRWEKTRIQSIDKNADGRLSRRELANIQSTPLDIDLTVDVAPVDPSRPQLSFHHAAGKLVDRTDSRGNGTLMLQNATVSISYRHIDPIAEAIDNAKRKFNSLDADINGFLDKTEIVGETLLERGLFEKMDFNRDQKLFADEIEDYVRQWAEVSALSCRVNVYDTGSGFFQAVDHNSDGRISVREMRTMKKSLAELQTDETPGVSRTEPARRYHIEFSRGSWLPFGPTARRTRETISFNTHIPIGPAWFIGSDRNNDGDLTWNEFLGHREDFHFLDTDKDGLIDPIEARRADKLKSDDSQPAKY